VHNCLGYGFLEKVYQRAMQVELKLRGFGAEIEKEIRVLYKHEEVGYYKADILVNELVIVELKVAKCYSSLDEAQLLNELKATGIRVGMLATLVNRAWNSGDLTIDRCFVLINGFILFSSVAGFGFCLLKGS